MNKAYEKKYDLNHAILSLQSHSANRQRIYSTNYTFYCNFFLYSFVLFSLLLYVCVNFQAKENALVCKQIASDEKERDDIIVPYCLLYFMILTYIIKTKFQRRASDFYHLLKI